MKQNETKHKIKQKTMKNKTKKTTKTQNTT